MQFQDFLRDFRLTSTELHKAAQHEQQLIKFIANLQHALNTLRAARHVFQHIEAKAAELEQLPARAEALRQEVEGLQAQVSSLKEARDTAHALAEQAQRTLVDTENLCQLRLEELRREEEELRRELGTLTAKRDTLLAKMRPILELEEVSR